MTKQSEYCLISGRERIVEVDDLACGCCTHSVFGFVTAAGCHIHDKDFYESASADRVQRNENNDGKD